MENSKIYALIQGIATDISAQYESIGVQSQVFIEPNIFRSTLKDGTIIDVTIENFNNYSLADKKKVMSLINNGLGDLYLSNDGTYKKPTMNNVINYNQPIIINSSDWIKISDAQYSLTVNHNLNNRNVIPIVYNSLDKVETLGIQRGLNKIVLESTEPINGMIVINYSVTDTNNSMNNIATIKMEYNFPTITDRDNYFNNTPISLKNGLIIAVGTNPTQLMSWNGSDSPSSYVSATDSSLWLNQTGLIRGERGEIGLQGIQGKVGQSVYDFAIEEQGFQGSISEYLESINSCVGEFTSFADLKIAYPNGYDQYKFAIIHTESKQVGIAFYKNSLWKVTIFASENGGSLVLDEKSVSTDVLGNIELFGFEDANIETIPIKYSDGTIKYLAIEKNSSNQYTTIATKEFVSEIATGALSLQDSYYNATTNTPDVTTISTGGRCYGWICNVSGTQILGSTTIELGINDILIKTSSGGFLKIDNSNTIVTWGIIGGDITANSSLINKLNEYAKIDDTDTTSTIKTYSNKHILELIDKHRKIFIQSDIPTDNININDIWVDITNVPYTMSTYSSSNSWIQIGSNGTTINDWTSSKEYKQGEFIIYNSLLYRCLIHNTDATFITTNWVLISGHVVKGNGTYYTKRSNLEFIGNGVNITDDSASDTTTITINADATTNTSQTFINKNIDAVNNTISNLSTTNFTSGIIVTDGTLVSNSDTKIPSEKAVKTYSDTKIPKVSSAIANDIATMNSDGTISDSGILKTDLLTKTSSGMKTTEIANCVSVNAVNSTNKTIYSTNITTYYENVHITGWFDIFYNTQSLATHHLKIDGNIIGTMQHYANNTTFCYTLPIDVVTSSIGVGSHVLSLVTTSNFAVTDSNTFKITLNMFEHL